MLLDFLQVLYALVDLVDRLMKVLAGDAEVVGKTVFKIIEPGLKVGHVHRLAPGDDQLPLQRDAFFGSLHEQRDDGDEKLRTDDVRFGIAVAHVHYSRVIELAVRLQHRHQHRIFAFLGAPVFVELF